MQQFVVASLVNFFGEADPSVLDRILPYCRVFKFEVRDKDDRTIFETLADVDIIVGGVYKPDVIMELPKLKMILFPGAGYQSLPVERATQRGILITYVPGVNSESVAEHTVGLILSLARHIPQANTGVRNGVWIKREPFWGTELKGKTLGILGLGNIGVRVGEIMEAFGMRVIYASRTSRPPQGRKWERVSAEDLFRYSDVLTLHCPATPETVGLVNHRTLSLMKPGSYLVNTARGALVDQDALYDALANGRLAGAALDVFVPEPAPPDHKLLSLPNVIVTPHIGGYTRESNARVDKVIVECIYQAVKGEEIPREFLVNPQVLDRGWRLAK